MPQVPYSPSRTVLPGGAATPYTSARGADASAFGAQLAEAESAGAGEIQRSRVSLGAAQSHEAAAIEGIGKVTEGFGDVLGRQALHFQTELNQSAAKDAFLAADVRLGELDAWHRTLEGRNAMDALPEYFKRANKIRDEVKASLPNNDARRMFDNDFARRLGFSLVDAGKYSATQFRQYQNHQDDSVVGLETQAAAKNWDNDEAFEDSTQKIKAASRAKSRRQGVSPEQADLAEMTAVGNAWRVRLANMSIYDPERAQALFEENREKIENAVNPAQLTDIQRHIKSGMDNLGARKAAYEIFNKFGKEEGPGALDKMYEEAEKRAEKTAPNDPQFLDNLRTRITSLWNNKKRAEKDQLDAEIETVNDALYGARGQAPTTLEELRAASPEAANIVDSWDKKKQSKVFDILDKNAKADPPMNEERFKRVQELKGMAVDRPAEFKNVNVLAEDLPKRSRGELMLMQRNIDKVLQQTHLTKGMAAIRSMLDESGIAQDKKGKDEFVGSFLDAIEDFQRDNKRPPNDKEYREIGAKLLRDTDPGLILSGPRLFQVSVPREERDKIVPALTRQLEREPTEDEIRRAYVIKRRREMK